MDLDSLNERQRQAVLNNEGALAVLSSAGSGKTRTVTTKIAYLINELDTRPTRIWACTFTNKAANEMKERLEPIIGDKAHKTKMSTIHSMAYHIYKQAMKWKYSWFKMPKIMVHEYGAISHLYKHFKHLNLASRDMKGYIQHIANLKLDLIGPEDLRAQNPTMNLDVDPEEHRFGHIESLYLVYKEYERWKEQSNQMDFQDILVNCYNTLKDPKYAVFLANLQERVEHLIVDEAQDTNTVSFKILDLMAQKHKNITIVGDTRQLIYSFQGARMENITGFIDKYSPKLIDLNVNYRSTKTIVDNANKLISYATEVIGEPAITPNEIGEPIKYFTSFDEQEESDRVMRLIDELHYAKGVPYKDITILYRVHSQAVPIEDQFIMNNIPYITFTKTSFYQRKEIKDIIEYLKLFRDPTNMTDAQLKRLANRPARFISNVALGKLKDFAFDSDKDIYEALHDVHSIWNINSFQKNALDKLYSQIAHGARLYRKGVSTKELVEYIIRPEEDNGMNYEQWAIDEKKQKDPDGDVSLNFDAILGMVARYPKPEDWFEHLKEIKKQEKEREERMKDPNGDWIKLMSIHASKGKEFKKVIIMGMCDRIFPFYRAVEECNEAEERRVMYVGLTRPQEELYLSVIRGKYGRYNVAQSPYITQMNIDYNGDSNVIN
jgi:DNA helicase-2/ATP-dependent DNA helicase PcrA